MLRGPYQIFESEEVLTDYFKTLSKFLTCFKLFVFYTLLQLKNSLKLCLKIPEKFANLIGTWLSEIKFEKLNTLF